MCEALFSLQHQKTHKNSALFSFWLLSISFQASFWFFSLGWLINFIFLAKLMYPSSESTFLLFFSKYHHGPIIILKSFFLKVLLCFILKYSSQSTQNMLVTAEQLFWIVLDQMHTLQFLVYLTVKYERVVI